MICWGQRDCCGVFNNRGVNDRCDCLRDYCIRDYEPDQRIMAYESQLDYVIADLQLKDVENLQELDKMLKIKSISNTHEFEIQNKQIIERLGQRLTELDFTVEIKEVKASDPKVPSHYVIFADYFSTPAKNVMLIYGNVDVPPVSNLESWTHEPFQLTQDGDMLYGRGLTSSKGPVVCWIQAIEAWKDQTNDLPVNLKLIIDSNQYSSNEKLRELIYNQKKFFRGVDLIVGPTNMWIAENVPMLTTCHSGYVYFELEVRHEKKENPETEMEMETETEPPLKTNFNPLHYKPPREPMAELCFLMNTLTDTKKGMLVEGLHRHVLPMTQYDWDILCQAEEGVTAFKEKTGAKRLPHESSHPEFLKYKWCMPGICMHGIKSSSNLQPVSTKDFHVPQKAVARFSVKLVPDQSITYATYMVREHLNKAYIDLKCEHPAYLRVLDELKPLNEGRHASFNLSAQRAFERVYDCRTAIPDTIHTCMPIMNELRKYCMDNAQMVGLPFCSIHMKPNQVDEGLTRTQYLQNIDLYATLLFEVALVPPECKCSKVPDFCYERGKSTERDFIRMIEPRNADYSHVLYELDEKQIDKTEKNQLDFPGLQEILLGDPKLKSLD